jgi:multicomponent Na+:H+ antiporter subunit B
MSLILRTATLYMQPVMLLFSLFLLLTGHNDPGGGFTGGLVAASAFALYAIAFGVPEARATLRVDPLRLIGAGLLVAAGSASASLFLGQPFMTGQWGILNVPGAGEIALGTPMLFDVGVYLVVVGVTITIVFSLVEEK